MRRIIDEEALKVAAKKEGDPYDEVYHIPGPLDLTALMELEQVPNRDFLRAPAFSPQPPRGIRWRRGDELFSAIARRDILMHHPFDSFDPVVDFINTAAGDPKVLAIKQTLYRTSGDSPITRALMKAAENGKHVTALVELKARFDEERNVTWARQMERSGVHVVFGFLDLKTHCKVSLVVRQDSDMLRRYVHLGTGNYNPTTALAYTDLGLFTAQEDIAEDASALFNLLTGYSQGHHWRKLVVAPEDLQRRTLELIEEQIERAASGRKSRIFAKLNALVDYRVIEALYRASQAGVPIELIVRGICCLRPGLPGISENIRVTSIVDRFLEHSRIYVFSPDEEAKVFLSSADWMPRNFHRRVEVMFPVEAPEPRDRILYEIIPSYLRDNVRSRILRTEGSYERIHPGPDEQPYRVQAELLQLRLRRHRARSVAGRRQRHSRSAPAPFDGPHERLRPRGNAAMKRQRDRGIAPAGKFGRVDDSHLAQSRFTVSSAKLAHHGAPRHRPSAARRNRGNSERTRLESPEGETQRKRSRIFPPRLLRGLTMPSPPRRTARRLRQSWQRHE